MTPPEVCPVCGEDVPRKALACPACGADERSGWNEENLMYDGLDLPDEAWGDDGSDDSPREGLPLIFKIAAWLVVIGILLWAVPQLSRLF